MLHGVFMRAHRWSRVCALAGVLAGIVGCGGSAFSAGSDGGGLPEGAPPESGSPGDASPPTDGAPHEDAGDDASPRADSGTCPTGTLTFTLDVAPDSAISYCTGATASCASEWLTILDSSGRDPLLDAACTADCGTCEAVACSNLCAAPSPIGSSGVHRSWDGSYRVSGTCGPTSLSCTSAGCAAAGHYVARMCGFPGGLPDSGVGSCIASSMTPTCVDIGFDWPPGAGATIVRGTLPGGAGADGGACCPSGQVAHMCTFSDGGSGIACHDPQEGCASSIMCGEGCDTVVTGCASTVAN